MKITCLIVDDEPLARNRLLGLVEDIENLVVIGLAKTGKEAISMIDSLQPNVVFLDIQMKDMSGFDVLKNIKNERKPLVIFVTAFDSYAIRAFDFLAFDYLLKPFKRERFNQSVSRVFEYFKNEKQSALDTKINDLLRLMETSSTKTNASGLDHKLPVKTGNTISFIRLDTIKYILASGSYVDICTTEKVLVQRTSLQNIFEEISLGDLIRIHRSTIININFIDKLIHSNYGEIDVKMTDGKLFRISKSYKKNFQNKMGI